jgi:hypothetical protein
MIIIVSTRKAKIFNKQAAYFPYESSLISKLALQMRAAAMLYIFKSLPESERVSVLTGFGLRNLDFLARTFDILLALNYGRMNLNPDP